MKTISACCGALLCLLAASCASRGPELPADQESKMRQHRLTPSEDAEIKGDSSQLPKASESSWKF